MKLRIIRWLVRFLLNNLPDLFFYELMLIGILIGVEKKFPQATAVNELKMVCIHCNTTVYINRLYYDDYFAKSKYYGKQSCSVVVNMSYNITAQKPKKTRLYLRNYLSFFRTHQQWSVQSHKSKKKWKATLSQSGQTSVLAWLTKTK